MSARSLAKVADCSASMISQIESGRVKPSVSTLYAITLALGISTDSLFNGAAPDGASDTGQDTSASQFDPAAVLFPLQDGARDAPLSRESAIVLRRAQRCAIDLERGVHWERLTPNSDPAVEFMEVSYAAGGGSSTDDHSIHHRGREYCVIIAGSLSVQIAFDHYVLNAGDSMVLDSTMPHRFWNAGTETVRAIWFVLDRWPL
jgi:transcriptional regulator with XRE-family HTH domain